MVSFEQIGIMFHLEALREENGFSQRQKDELLSISSKIINLKVGIIYLASNLKEYKQFEADYIKKFEAYNGDTMAFNSRLRAFESSSTPYMLEAKKAIYELKKKMRL